MYYNALYCNIKHYTVLPTLHGVISGDPSQIYTASHVGTSRRNDTNPVSIYPMGFFQPERLTRLTPSNYDTGRD